MDAPAQNAYLDELAKEAMAVGGILLKVSGKSPSMLGSGYAGNSVIIVPQAEYAPGDDVVFKNANGSQTLHGVTHVKPGFVYTKGSFNQRGDGWIPLKDVIGKVTQTVRAKK